MAYIFMDLIGIKNLLQTDKNKAEEICQQFWEISKSKALYDDLDGKYVTFSDSLLIYFPNNKIPKGANLISWINDFGRIFYEKLSCDFFIIINIGEEIKPSSLHEVLAIKCTSSNPNDQTYVHIAGLGSDFANIFTAEDKIKEKRKTGELDKNLKVYINQLLIKDIKIKTTSNSVEFTDIYGKIEKFIGFCFK